MIKATQHGLNKNKWRIINLTEINHKLIIQHGGTQAVDVIYLDFHKPMTEFPHNNNN